MKKKPSELELQILSLLWKHRNGLTAREVMEALPDGKLRAYTSVLSVMQTMEKKGFLSKEREGMAHRWLPIIKQKPTVKHVLGDLLKKVFSNRPSEVMQHLLDSPQMTDQEMATIKQMIAEAEKRKGKKP